MSIQSEIDRIEQNVADTYSVLEEVGAPMPASADSDNLAGTAASISAVLYNKEQNLSDAQKQQARDNIGVPIITQGPGQSENLVMSQKAVTDFVNSLINGDESEYEIVDSVSEMTDTTKSYILSTTGTIWKYLETEVEVEVEKTDQIVGTADNPWGAGRLSSGNPNGAAGYVTTPYIDLTKYSVPFTLHLKGIPFSNKTPMNAGASNLRYSQYDTSKVHLLTELTNSSSFVTYWKGAVLTDVGDGTVEIAFTPPVTNKSDVAIGYARFSGYGTEAEANVYVVYMGTESQYVEQWTDTGIAVSDITKFELENPDVKNYVENVNYADDPDYTTSDVLQYAAKGYYRKDIPLPVLLKWEKDLLASQYVIALDTNPTISRSNNIKYYTSDTFFAIYNLIPGITYYYEINALHVDGTINLVKNGNFTTQGQTRMLNIDGIQNVRDIGGYTGLNSKKVKYGLLFRGSAMDEAVSQTLSITDKGKQELLLKEVGVKTDIDLRYGHSESILGPGVDYINTTSGYENYANVFTVPIQRTNFANLLEKIVDQLEVTTEEASLGEVVKPGFIHCQGGCDRTGTLVFQLLGLLGVSENDLAKEYELSSFSNIGYTRTRNSANYSGMVAQLKTYSGSTIYEKFIDFATKANDSTETGGCGIAQTLIDTFQSIMLE